MRPQVSDNVLFFLNGGTESRAAIVCAVSDDGKKVNLCVFTEGGMPSPYRQVRFCDDGEDRPTGEHFCEWPYTDEGSDTLTYEPVAGFDALPHGDDDEEVIDPEVIVPATSTAG